MNGENIAGIVIMAVCCFGSALLFSVIGLHANKADKPVHFWAGSTIDPENVSDIRAYNRKCAIMWLWYSIPYCIAGAVAVLGGGEDSAIIISAFVLAAACIPGIPILIFHYRRIEKRYISR